MIFSIPAVLPSPQIKHTLIIYCSMHSQPCLTCTGAEEEAERINTVRVQTSRSAAQQKLFPGLFSILLCRHFSVLSLTEVWIWKLVSKQFSLCRSWLPFTVRLKLLSSLSFLLTSSSLLQSRQLSLISFFLLFWLCVFGCLSAFPSLSYACRGELYCVDVAFS